MHITYRLLLIVRDDTKPGKFLVYTRVFVWVPWRQHVGKLPDPAAEEPPSDYRSERLHAVELARSETPTPTHT